MSYNYLQLNANFILAIFSIVSFHSSSLPNLGDEVSENLRRDSQTDWYLKSSASMFLWKSNMNIDFYKLLISANI